jgi:hypothetical protein
LSGSDCEEPSTTERDRMHRVRITLRSEISSFVM